MAARSTTRRDDEDALDPVEAVNIDDPDDEPDAEADLEDAPDLEDDPDLDDDSDEEPDLDAQFDDAEPDLEEELDQDAESLDDLTEAEALGDDAEGEGEAAELPPEAVFDDDEIVAVVAAVESEGDEDVDGLREGEFVCRSCHMAKRETQLADKRALLCRDCA